MKEMIELEKLDDLYKEFQDMGYGDEKFSDFVKETTDNGEPVWTLMSWSGAVTKEFIEENFEELAHTWFKGLEAQMDFGVLLECVREEFDSKVAEWERKKLK